MKKIILGLVGAILALTVVTSCKKLDLTPYDAVAIETGFTTLQDARYWDNGMYAALRDRVYGGYNILQEVQGEQLNASLDFGNRNGASHRWGSFFNADDLAGIYRGYYSGLSNVNIVIKGYEQIPASSAVETDTLNTFKADARFLRAFYLHNLALRYAKAYNPSTAASDPGIPLITEFDLTAKPARASLKATYDQILADIGVAKSLSKKRNLQGARYITPDAILAFEARVRLYMQDWSGAYTVANTLIGSGRYTLYNTAASIKSYWTNDTFQEDIFRIVATLAEGVNTNSIYLGFNSGNKQYVPDFIPTQSIIDSYADADLRKATYFEQKNILIQGVRYSNVWLVNKYPGNPILFTTPNVTNYQNANKILRIGEVYAIAAEAAANAGDFPNAMISLNALRTSRGLTALSGLSGTPLMDQIRAERTRELNFEGLHLFDLKRWGQGFTRGAAQVEAAVNPNTGFINLTISATDPKFTWGLPTNDLILNPNLVQNPGW